MKFDQSPIDTAAAVRPTRKKAKKHDDVNILDIIGNDQSIPNPVTNVNIPPSTMPTPQAQVSSVQPTPPVAVAPAAPVMAFTVTKKIKKPKGKMCYEIDKDLLDAFRDLCKRKGYNQTEIIASFLTQFCQNNY